MTTAGLGGDDFMEAIEAVGGCPHLPIGAPQNLDTICTPCREAITSLVLIREAYRRDPVYFVGKREK